MSVPPLPPIPSTRPYITQDHQKVRAGFRSRCCIPLSIKQRTRHELIDEFRLWTFPVVVGRGKRLFSDGTIPAALKLVDSTVCSTGVVTAHACRRARSSQDHSRWMNRPVQRTTLAHKLERRSRWITDFAILM
jgi:hypothetical protein